MTDTKPRFLQFALAYTVLCAITLVWVVAKWRGWIGGEPLFRPLRSVLLISFLTSMAAGWVALHRMQRLANALLCVTIALFLLLAANMMAG